MSSPAIPGDNTNDLSKAPDLGVPGRRNIVEHGYETHSGGGGMEKHTDTTRFKDFDRSASHAADDRGSMIKGNG